MQQHQLVWFLFEVLLAVCLSPASGKYFVGTAKYDITGPASQINFMGYAKPSQTAAGIHQRLFARAFVISQVQPQEQSPPTSAQRYEESLDPDSTICFVSIDYGMGSDLVTQKVIERLHQSQGNTLCQVDNLSISGTHTHSAPAGFLQYALFQIPSLGFSHETLHVMVNGIVQALQDAYETMQLLDIALQESRLFDSNRNRSPTSYILNPELERLSYPDGDTDKQFIQLSFVDQNETAVAVLNWFAVHGTSLNSTNRLISGDNKGYASYLSEQYWKSETNNNDFVAAFASTNLGDVSPNTFGPHCLDTGLPCDTATSSCNGNCLLCVASGPGRNMRESTEMIGRRQFEASQRLLLNSTVPVTLLSGPVASRHSFIDMSNLTVQLKNETVTTCPGALGYSFAGGTTDGPGDFPFQQGTNRSTPLWDMLGGFLSRPSSEQIACHAPKPILLNSGQTHLPYPWEASVVPISIFRIGSFFILNVPAEMTTMAGRRLRKAIRQILLDHGVHDPEVVIAGLANSYTHYVTTIEEYQGQRYEAASTLFGPHTLSAYIQEFERIALDLLNDIPSFSVDPPKDHSKQQISLMPPVAIDMVGLGYSFGSVAVDVKESYRIGETTAVTFRSANPRNNFRINDTFLTVEAMNDNGDFQVVHVDHDWCTRFHWKEQPWGFSFAEISWEIPPETPRGLYRICHFGTRRTILGGLQEAIARAPSWTTINALGSPVFDFLLQTFKLVARYSSYARHLVDNVAAPVTKDFHGCTRTFLVH